MDGDYEYNDTNRAFLQALMGRGFVTFRDAQEIIAGLRLAAGTEDVKLEHITQHDVDYYINSASDAVSQFDYQVRSAVHQANATRVWALVNTTSDPSTQLATTFTPDELSFVKRVFDAIFDTYNTPRMEKMCVTMQEAISLSRPPRNANNPNTSINDGDESQAVSTDKGLRHSDVNRVIEELVEGGWLEKSPEGFYSPAPRALMELRTWLLDTYNDPDVPADEWQRIKTCEACRDIVTYGYRCNDRDCLVRLHDSCEERFWRARRSKTCPKCGKAWEGNRFVGERAVTTTKTYRQARGRGRKSNTLASDIFNDAQGGGLGNDGGSVVDEQ
ncbi:hypothetical protein jhhlp_003654 [Lomentospora prolificans]|uniref:Non-structural maintenance of chromosomes element 1 homolog n=1 Tax=Lomentospora prolificans TaxID=41688 RepID=A0A2N3N9E0_9PEZI|nr:hypothetical protein jhhlp_003654 [Lomentospora prolificans]